MMPAILWDERKRLANIETHGIDFADITPGFFESAILYPTYADRQQAIGLHEGRVITVIIKALGTQGLSIISARLSSDKEKKAFRER